MANPIWDGTDADNDYTAATNFVADGAPASTDDVVLPPMAHADGTDIDGVADTAVLLASFTIMEGCFIDIGTPGIAPTYLRIDTDLLDIDAAGIVCLDVDNCATTIVRDCASDSTEGEYGLYLVGAGSDPWNALLTIASTCSGDVSIASLAGETATFTTINADGGNVTIGSGVTMTTLNVGGGVTVNKAAATTVTVTGGTFTHEVGAVTALNCDGGTTYYNAVETVTTISVKSEGILDFSQDLRAKTVTNPIEVFAGATIIDPHGVVASLVLDCNGCTINEINLTSPPNTRWTRAAVA